MVGPLAPFKDYLLATHGVSLTSKHLSDRELENAEACLQGPVTSPLPPIRLTLLSIWRKPKFDATGPSKGPRVDKNPKAVGPARVSKPKSPATQLQASVPGVGDPPQEIAQMETSASSPPSGGNAVSTHSRMAENSRIASLDPGPPSVARLDLVCGLMKTLRETGDQLHSSGGGAKDLSNQIEGADITVNPEGCGFAKSVLQICMASGKYEGYLRDLGYAQMQATKMARMIATGDAPQIFRPPKVTIGGKEMKSNLIGGASWISSSS